MTLVQLSPADEQKLKAAVTAVVLPLWKNTCNKVDPKCNETWNATVGKAARLQDRLSSRAAHAMSVNPIARVGRPVGRAGRSPAAGG